MLVFSIWLLLALAPLILCAQDYYEVSTRAPVDMTWHECGQLNFLHCTRF